VNYKNLKKITSKLLQAIESPTKSPNEVQVTKEIVAWKAHFVSFAKQLTFLGVMHHCSSVVWVFFSFHDPKMFCWCTICASNELHRFLQTITFLFLNFHKS
jgi:hypothetical protein